MLTYKISARLKKNHQEQRYLDYAIRVRIVGESKRNERKFCRCQEETCEWNRGKVEQRTPGKSIVLRRSNWTEEFSDPPKQSSQTTEPKVRAAIWVTLKISRITVKMSRGNYKLDIDLRVVRG